MDISKALWCVDSPKAIKAREYGALNAILYMAPATVANVGNLCPNASEGCRAACLAMYSGQAGMVKGEALNNVRRSRIDKARAFMRHRREFMRALALQLARTYAKANAEGLRLVARPNGGTDIAWEGVAISVDAALAAKLSRITGETIEAKRYRSLFELFPFVLFNDYTKSEKRMLAYVAGKLPSNYHLTFSRAENNAADVANVVALGGNVAVVFDQLPSAWHGVAVIDGDKHDLRALDPRGVIVGLTPKGLKAKRDQSGFIVRTRAN